MKIILFHKTPVSILNINMHKYWIMYICKHWVTMKNCILQWVTIKKICKPLYQNIKNWPEKRRKIPTSNYTGNNIQSFGGSLNYSFLKATLWKRTKKEKEPICIRINSLTELLQINNNFTECKAPTLNKYILTGDTQKWDKAKTFSSSSY